MSKFRVAEIKGNYYVQGSWLGLFWTRLGKPCFYDGGWMGAEVFSTKEDALKWMNQIVCGDKEKKRIEKLSSKPTIHYNIEV